MASSNEARKQRQRVDGKRRAEQREKASAGTCFRIPSGMTLLQIKGACKKRLDVVPYTVGKGNPFADPGFLHYERTYYMHPKIGAEGKPYCCLQMTFKKACPICEAKASFIAAGKEEESKELRYKERQLWLVIDLDDAEKGLQIFDYSFHLFGKHLDEYIQESDEDDTHFRYFADPEEGSTLKVYFREESTGSHKFYDGTRIEFLPRKKPLSEKILESAPCLDDLLIEFSYKDLKDIFYQTAKGKDADEEEVGGKDLDDDDKDADDDDDEPAPPPGKSKASVPAPATNGKSTPVPAKAKGGIAVGRFVKYKKREHEVIRVLPSGMLEIQDEDERTLRVSPDQVTLITDKGQEDTEEVEEEEVVEEYVEEKEEEVEEDGDEDDEEEDEPAPPKKKRK